MHLCDPQSCCSLQHRGTCVHGAVCWCPCPCTPVPCLSGSSSPVGQQLPAAPSWLSGAERPRACPCASPAPCKHHPDPSTPAPGRAAVRRTAGGWVGECYNCVWGEYAPKTCKQGSVLKEQASECVCRRGCVWEGLSAGLNVTLAAIEREGQGVWQVMQWQHGMLGCLQ